MVRIPRPYDDDPPTTHRTRTSRFVSRATPTTLDSQRCAGSLPQKGVTTYALSQNRQKPLGGAFNAAIFNTFRRTRQQILFWAPPMIAGYSIMQWAIERYVNDIAHEK